MPRTRKSIHGQWSSRWAFILAATGSAVGLGNIWRFPYITGEHGGGAFVLVYILCIIGLGIPILMSEVMLGRRGRQSPINTMRTLSEEEGASRYWQYLGWMGVLAGFLILSFYSVVGGWTMAYVVRSVGGTFAGVTATDTTNIFNNLVSDPERLLAWHTLFMVLTTIVVARGVQHGLEKAVRFLMPALFVLLLIMVGYSLSTAAFTQAVHYLFTPDFSNLQADDFLVALGQAFFSLSLGMGAIMIYGSYLPAKASISRTAVTIAFMDTMIAIFAGLAIFPLVFSYGLEVGQGTGLIFQTLPIAFGQMPYGTLFGTLFFVLLMFAAWTSSISLLEPAVAWLAENRDMRRVNAAIIAGIIAWVMGVGSLLSFNLLSDNKLFGKTFFELVEYLTTNIMLPLGGLLTAVFAAWIMKRMSSTEELDIGDGLGYRLWLLATRYLAPAGVTVIFLQAIGIINLGS
ncbi:MAG: sodium-dependent transporter [Gammaproteobacteria bacterium]|nr:sodium-dependent transporter [Gammaproteobacteria bacterium]